LVARIVFGEARGESEEGQFAVAFTVHNRVHHKGYPSSVQSVAYQRYGNHYQYNTLDEPTHDNAWENSKSKNSAEYKNAMKAARDAHYHLKSDPTKGATDYCAYDPRSATDDNKYWYAKDKRKIGNHYFVRRELKPKSSN